MSGGAISRPKIQMGQSQSSFDEDSDALCTQSYDRIFSKYESKLPRLLKLQSQRHYDGQSESHASLKTPNGMHLEHLPTELCLQILSKLEINSLSKMARVSKYWNRLANQDILFQKASASRFHIHPSRFPFLSLNPHESRHRWKEIYTELDLGIASWSGYALDYITNSGNPYEMELIIKSTDSKLVRGPTLSDKSNFFNLTQFEGCCRWKTLADSLTNTLGAVVDPEGSSSKRFEIDPFLSATFSRHITFTETEVIRGLDLVVPNIYQGLVCSNVILGSFDPGHPDLVGSFICVLQESLPLDFYGLQLFRSGRKFKGVWITSLDKPIYMYYKIDKVSCAMVTGTVELFPIVSCRTTTRPAPVELDNPVSLQFQFRIDSSPGKAPRIHHGQFSFLSSSFYHQIWVQECVPILERMHLNLFGDTITGLFSDPRPGCFFLNPIN